jgi:hypothetical protein
VYGVTSPEPEPEFSESENESDESDSEAFDSTQQQYIGVLSDAAAIVAPTAPAGNGVAVEGSQVDGAYKISPMFVLIISKASFARRFRNGGDTCTRTQWRWPFCLIHR